jgi:integrase
VDREQWLVRVSLGRHPETGTRIITTERSGLAPRGTNVPECEIQERDIGRLPRAAAIRLDHYLDHWFATSATPELRPKSYTDYEGVLRLNIRPCLGTKSLGAITQFDQSVYAQIIERGLSARTIEYTSAVLQSAFRQVVRWKMLADDPPGLAWTYRA